jgi:hypothetical protein
MAWSSSKPQKLNMRKHRGIYLGIGNAYLYTKTFNVLTRRTQKGHKRLRKPTGYKNMSGDQEWLKSKKIAIMADRANTNEERQTNYTKN